MKIVGQQPDISPAAGQAVQSVNARSGTSMARNDRKAPEVDVTVSSQTRALEQVGGSADVDMDKVNAVRQAIANNTFAVNPETIADRLLANAREMLDRTRS